jgi:fatty acid kinase fatty acid binding subunit
MYGPSSTPSGRYMAYQQHTSRVRIVADSSTDILPHHARALGIVVVPNLVVMDGTILRDGIDLTSTQFFSRLPHLRTMPYTLPAAPRDFYRAYQAAFNQGATEVLSIHVSSRLSQVIQHAAAARERMAQAPIYLLDSLQAGIGIWPAVTKAAQLASRGAPIHEVYDTASSILARTHIYFVVETLEYLRRGGRIGRAQELLGTVLGAHPILTIRDGEVTPLGTVRLHERALLHMRDLALAEEPEAVLICASTIERINEIERLIQQRYAGIIEKTWLGPTLGANAGPVTAIAVVAR